MSRWRFAKDSRAGEASTTGIDGVGLVMASVVLTLVFYRKGQDLVAAGFLVFAVGEGIILSGAAMDLTASVPSFGAGTSLFAAVLFAATAVPIFAGVPIMPTTHPHCRSTHIQCS